MKTQIEIKDLWRKEWVWVLGIMVVITLWYAVGVPRQASGYGNSDELLNFGYNLGVARSPGYPLYVLLLYVWTHLLHPLVNIAMAGNILSAVLGGISVGMVFSIAWRMYEVYGQNKKSELVLFKDKNKEKLLLALLTTSFWAFSRSMWTYSQVAERHSLSVLFVSLLIWIVISYQNSTKIESKEKWLWVGILSLGLSIAHQWLFWLFIPIFAYVIWLDRKKISLTRLVLPIVIAVVLAIGSLELLSIYYSRAVNYSWKLIPSLSGIFSYVGKNYWGDGVAQKQTLGAVLSEINFNQIFTAWWQGMVYAIKVFGWGLVAILIMTATALRTKSNRKQMLLWIGSFLLVSLATALMWGWPIDKFILAQIIPGLLADQLLLAITLWFGWRELIKRVGASVAIIGNKKLVDWLMLFTLVLVITLGVSRWKEVNLSAEQTNYTLNQQVMKAAANNAIIACFNLMSCQGLIFAQQSEGERPDITIVPYDYLPSVRFLKADLVGIGYNNYPWVLYDIITWNIKNRPIYVVNLPNNYYDFLGIDFGFMHYVPMEYFGQLTQKIPLVLPQNNYQMTQGLITQKLPDWDMMRQTVKVNVAKDHIFNASIWFKMGQRNLAYQEMNLATNLFYGFEENERKQITQIREMVERTSPNNFFKLGYGVEKTAFIIDQSNELYKEGLSKRALQIAQGAVTVDPTNIKARINWADIMESVGATDSAILEYNNVLKLEPTNKEAKEKIAKFSHTNSNTITPGFGLQE